MMLLISPLRSACSTCGVEATTFSGRSTAAVAKITQHRRSATLARMLRVWRDGECKAWNMGRRGAFEPGVESDAMGVQPVEPNADEAIMHDLRRQAGLTAPLESERQSALLERSAEGDRASQDRVVAANLGMVIRLAEARDGTGLSAPDLVQEGSLGLLEAVRSFTGSGEPNFAAFAERKVSERKDAG